METPTASTSVADAVARIVERRLPPLARYAGADHLRVPAPLRKPFSRQNWRALGEDLRLRNIRERVTEQVAADVQAREAKHAAYLASLKESLPVTEEAPAPVMEAAPVPRPATLTRYVVGCAAGCGEFHPASSHRPVLVLCGGVQRSAKQGKRSIYGGDESTEATERLIAKLKREAEWATAEAGAPKPRKKPKKVRRKAECSTSRAHV